MSVGCDPIGRGLVRQGDLLLVPVAAVPDGARELGSGRLVLLRGEATRKRLPAPPTPQGGRGGQRSRLDASAVAELSF